MKVYSMYILLLSMCVTLLTTSCKEEKQVIKQVEVPFTKEGELSLLKKGTDSLIQRLDIELATSQTERDLGLMYRNELKDHQGMLFVFPNSAPRGFYMRNTYIPLDIIFLDENSTIISMQKDAKPMDESSLPSNGSAQYVLEINAGLSKKWNLEVGDTIDFFAL
ncbi:DUF192 domain-containing protein [Bizionia paragorgiae]|uniref:DUF192 domain-containing protein n=1 Tax=Bizionia paragorgiae TaxID=283786 RepID=A0A1H3ZQK7_BIZPA|nr:DUF192 domain-containing protein [Bizionia paragorgiae]SEA25562.1 hypothetical protein SAMN04487990_1095 [Bizionia paragorgiae]